MIAHLPIYQKLGYVANSFHTVAGGTFSAGRLYDKVGDAFFARVMFTTQTKIICKVETAPMHELTGEIFSQNTQIPYSR